MHDAGGARKMERGESEEEETHSAKLDFQSQPVIRRGISIIHHHRTSGGLAERGKGNVRMREEGKESECMTDGGSGVKMR